MKQILKPFLKYYLKYLTKIALFLHKPIIIAVAGSANKPFVKNEIKQTLMELGLSVRANPKNFNTEFGLPLAVLDLPSGYNSYKNWLPAIKNAPKKIFSRSFPKYLVLGLGTSDPGDLKYLLTIIKPKIAVITDITQRYLEGFQDMNELVKEYQYLARNMQPDGLLILNHDNERVRTIKSESRIIYFGTGEGVEWRATGISDLEEGQRFTVEHEGQRSEVLIHKFGKHHIFAHLIAQIVKSYVTKQHKHKKQEQVPKKREVEL